MNKNIRYIAVAGFGWSGSGAVVDLLKEYEGIKDPDVEFRLLKDPYCINDLYNSLVIKADPLNYDIAIRDFLWYTRKLMYKASKWNLRVGLDYEQSFGKDFVKKSENYINGLVDFKYDGYWWMFEFKDSKFQFFIRKIKKHLYGKHPTERMYFSAPSEEDFLSKTRAYIDDLFSPYVDDGKVDRIVLDQGISTQNYKNEMKYLGDVKLIIVDRDPRDIYTDLCMGRNLIGADLAESHDVEKYAIWHKGYRRNIDDIRSDKDILYIKFEDLVLKYDETIDKIEQYLELPKEKHIAPKTRFIPEKSAKNLGMWKKYLSENEKTQFDKLLSDFYTQSIVEEVKQ